MSTKRTTIFASVRTLLVLAFCCPLQDCVFAQDSSPPPRQAQQDASTDTQNAEYPKRAAQGAITYVQEARKKVIEAMRAEQDAITHAQKVINAQKSKMDADNAAQKAQREAATAQKAKMDADDAAQKAQRASGDALKAKNVADDAAQKAEDRAKATQKAADFAEAKRKRNEAKIAHGEYTKAFQKAATATRKAMDAGTSAAKAQDAVTEAQKAVTDAQQVVTDAQDGVTDAQQAITDAQKRVTDAQKTAADAQAALEAEAPGAAQAAQEALAADRAALTAATATQREVKAAKRASGATTTLEKNHPTMMTGNPMSCLRPGVERTGAYYDALWRPMAGTDYIVLGYDVHNHFVKWYDYEHQGAAPIFVNHNGSLVPVVYSREKVLVHVCGLHPTDTVSISTNDLSVPEQGADIRGATAVSTATPLAPTLDALGSAPAAGTALSPAGFSFGAPPSLPNNVTGLFTPGSSKDGSTYSDAVVNISPQALALEYTVVTNNANDAQETIKELEKGPPDNGFNAANEGLPGSVEGLHASAKKLLGDLKGASGAYTFDNTGKLSSVNGGPNALPLSVFNDYLARTQTLVSQVNGLGSGVNLASLPARAVALRQNFEAVMGAATQVTNLIALDEKLNQNPVLGPVDTTQKPPPPPQQAYYDKNPGGSVDGVPSDPQLATCGNLYDAISNGRTLFTAKVKQKDDTDKAVSTVTYSAYSPADNVTCHAMELYMMNQFMDRFNSAIDNYAESAVKVMILAVVQGNLLNIPEVTIQGLDGTEDLTAKIKTNYARLLDPNVRLMDKVVNANELSGAVKALADPEIVKALSDKQINIDGKSIAAASSKIERANATLQTITQTCIPNVECIPTALENLFVSIAGSDKYPGSRENSLRGKLEALDNTVGQVFFVMNRVYEQSWVEQTDALPPVSSNIIVRIGINVQRNYTPFTLSGGATIGAGSPASTPTPASSKGNPSGNAQGGSPSASGNTPSSATSTSGSNDITLLMEVHRYANFNLVGGVMAIHVPTFSITTVPKYAAYGLPSTTTTTSGTTYTYSALGTCNGGVPMLVSTTTNSTGVAPAPTLYYCYQSSQKTGLQPAGMSGIAWFPLHRDYFSRERGDAFMWRNWVPSLLLASSITSLGSAFLGPNFEPVNGLDLFAGYASAHQQSLPSSVSPYAVYQAGSTGNPPTLNTTTHLKVGPTFGVGFDLNVFLQLFSKTQGPSLP